MTTLSVTAPGKIILFGEHAVVYGKLSVAVSLNLRTTAKAKPLKDKISVSFSNCGFQQCWDVSEFAELYQRWPNGTIQDPPTITEESLSHLRNFINHVPCENNQGITALLVFLAMYLSITQSNRNPNGLETILTSELPIGSGLGSSASLSTCIVTVLLHHVNALSSLNVESEKLSVEDLELINKWSYAAEMIIHGKPSGIDNSVCTFGGCLKFKSGKMDPLQGIPNLKVLLVNTNIPRSTKALVTKVYQLHQSFPQVTNPIFDAIDAIADTACTVLSEAQTQQQDERTLYGKLETLISMNQPLLAALGVSHSRLNDICRLAAEHGLQAKLTGAGGGGCVYVLIPPYVEEKEVKILKNKLESQGFQTWETDIGGSGVQVKCYNTKDCTSQQPE